MSKLFKLKEWLTLPDAAKYLSNVFDENITEADILQLAIEEKLSLSVFFMNEVSLRRLKKFSVNYLVNPTKPPPEFENAILISGTFDGKESFSGFSLKQTDEICIATGVYGLLMGSGIFDIINKYHQVIKGDGELSNIIDRYYLEDSLGNFWELVTIDNSCEFQTTSTKVEQQLIQHIENSHMTEENIYELPIEDRYITIQDMRVKDNNYYPISKLPKECVFVVRTEALRDFERRVTETPEQGEEKPLATTERNSLLTIIGLMANDGYGNDLSKPYPLAKEIQEAAELLGIKISDDTIAGKFKEAKKILVEKSE